MRLRLGRPRLDLYRDRFDVPPAEGDLSVTFRGVTTLLFADAEGAFLTDGFFTRPSAAAVLLRRLESDEARIDNAMRRAGITNLDGVVAVHSHFDHALDSVAVAQRARAPLIGGRSIENVGRGGGLTTRE